jgi:hypothetical protein
MLVRSTVDCPSTDGLDATLLAVPDTSTRFRAKGGVEPPPSKALRAQPLRTFPLDLASHYGYILLSSTGIEKGSELLPSEKSGTVSGWTCGAETLETPCRIRETGLYYRYSVVERTIGVSLIICQR